MKKFGFSVLLAAITLAIVAVPALALPPETYVYEISYGPEFYANCSDFGDYDFEIWTAGEMIWTESIFFNPDGTLNRTFNRLRGEDRFYNYETGKLLAGTFAGNATYFPQTETWVFNGLGYHIIYPGMGPVLLDAGRVIEDLITGEYLFLAGPKMSLGEYEKLCEALSE